MTKNASPELLGRPWTPTFQFRFTRILGQKSTGPSRKMTEKQGGEQGDARLSGI
ncbi:hypothetical protein F2Q69_00035027 [Brassica cretica]|uniref:Uncharacterized protein n=1 Tax=Brassica cretica TaxID=69181 RepID=A0A8S9SLK9_BRACR|nr:hypothetical protein F2Q69_00035027 [Brassica cretica]